MLNYTSNYIEIENEYISKIFTSTDLLSMEISGKKNCCTPLPSIKYDLEYNPKCNYVGIYQNYVEQSTCNPGGDKDPEDCITNPISSYYKNILELYVFLNGASVNILTKAYDMTLDTDIVSLIEDINTFFASKDMNPTVGVNTDYNADDFLKVEVSISDLPTNVIFEKFILANDETCYVEISADCDLGIRCNINKFTLPVGAQVTTLITDKGAFNPNVTVTPSTLSNAIESIMAFLDDTSLSMEYIGNDLFINGVNNPILYIKYNYAGQESIAFPTCEGYEEEIPKCIYSVKIPLEGVINSFTGYNNTENFTSPIFTDSVVIDLDTLSTDLNSMIPTGNIEVTTEEDLIVLTFSDVEFIPFKLEVDNENYYFQCDQVTYFESVYDPEQIEFVSNGIRIKPGYLGTITSGIYNFTITTETETQVITDTYCLFVDLDLKCKIAKLTDLEKLEDAILLYEALLVIHECMDCECENACILFQELYEILSSYNLVDNGCNC